MKLKEYLEKNEMDPRTFAKKIGSNYRSIYYAMDGKDIKASLAAKIEIATLGTVKCVDLFDFDKNFINLK